MSPRPWLIVTKQRSGGTSLTKFLAAISPNVTAEHEPFNTGRVYDHVIPLLEQQSREDMNEALSTILDKGENIKHCYCQTPLELTQDLITQARARNYHIIRIERLDEKARQRSRMIAQTSEMWGRADDVRFKRRFKRFKSGELKVKNIPVQQLRTLVHDHIARTEQVSEMLAADDFINLTFEGFYTSDTPTQAQATSLARDLGLLNNVSDNNLMLLEKEKPAQKRKRLLEMIDNLDEADLELSIIFIDLLENSTNYEDDIN